MICMILLTILMSWNLFNYLKDVKNRKEASADHPHNEDVGQSQWINFTLKSTPEIRKKGVTDISKYYT